MERFFGVLPIRSLKNARLASKQWADVGARCLFKRIYFTPRDAIMQVFTEITQNAAFASNVETLVYDARLFWRHMENPEVYRAAQRRGFPDDFYEDTPESETNGKGIKIDPPSETAYMESAIRYSDLLRQQTAIFDTQKDFDVLRAGLRRLANLKYIPVLDYFADHLDFIPFCWAVDELRWYHDWSAALCKDRFCDTPHPPDLLSDRHFKTMKDVVQKIDHLRSLSLTITRTSDDFYEVFRNAKWSHLTILELGEGAWFSEEIEELVSSHADTLRELRLRNVEIIDGDPWEVVAERLGQSLQLHLVCLMNLHDLKYPSQLTNKRVERSVRLFMKRAPNHLLDLKVEYGTAIAWQKQKFKPAYDFDRILNSILD
ncbi:MAG: hypothetical protein Q9194_003200 [Teloschistes cf. exilis]